MHRLNVNPFHAATICVTGKDRMPMSPIACKAKPGFCNNEFRRPAVGAEVEKRPCSESNRGIVPTVRRARQRGRERGLLIR